MVKRLLGGRIRLSTLLASFLNARHQIVRRILGAVTSGELSSCIAGLPRLSRAG